MSQQSVLHHWPEEVRKNMPHLSKPQSKVLAASASGSPSLISGSGLGAPAPRLHLLGSSRRKTKIKTYPCQPIKGEGIR